MLNIINLDNDSAREEMGKPDEYMRHTTASYRSLFAKDSEMSSFKKLMINSVLPPTEHQIDMVQQSQEIINKSLEMYDLLNLEMEMGMIYTNGTDNVGMPYTKGLSMVMPSNYHFPPGVLSYLNPHLVAHELWHILSRKNPELRKKAYKAIGFKESNSDLMNKSLKMDFNLQEKYFINPDAISHDHYFEHTLDNSEKIELYPIFIMMNGMAPALACVRNDDIFDIKPLSQCREYVNAFENVGYNTHPEEICAEHFRMMIMDKHEKIIEHLPNKLMMKNFIEVVEEFFK